MSSYPNPPAPYQPPPPSPYAPGGFMRDANRGSRLPRQYGAFSALILAPMFHAGLARDVAQRWRGIGALYLLLLVAITGAVSAADVHFSFAKFLRDDFPTFVQDVPPINIRDGVV